MRQLLPEPVADIAAYDAYRPADPHAPLLRLDMVTSLDGSATDASGVTDGLGGEGDFEVFRSLRALADGILVGAGTVRAEGYGPHRVRADLAERRRADGRAEPAPVVVVSASLALDADAALFTEARTPTVVVTCARAPAERRRALADVGRVLVAGDERVDLVEALGLLRSEGLAHLVCEGGPQLNGELLRAGLVDELCLTLAPQLVAGQSARITSGWGGQATLALQSVLTDGAELYTRYRVRP